MLLCYMIPVAKKDLWLVLYEESLRGVRANVLDCDTVVSEFELQSRYYVYFQTKTPEKV